jgi:AraC family transcriptional regulator
MFSMKLSNELHGRVLRSRTVSEFQLLETAYDPGAKLSKHSHERAHLCLVLRGTYSEIYGKRIRHCKPAALFFYSPGVEHSNQFHGSYVHCFNAQVSSEWLERVRGYASGLDSGAEFYGGVITNLAVKLYNEFRLMDETAPLAIEGLMLEIAAEASRHPKVTARQQTPARIERAKEYLHEHFQESISLEHVAKLVEAHPTYLAREFRRYNRCTIGEYVRRLRVEFACSKLAGSDEPLANIALAAGFSDQSHFSRTIKSLTGTSPNSYRKIHRSS